MLVEVRNNDMSVTKYGFEPEHKSEAIGYYTKLYWTNQIQGFRAIMADGSVVAIGAN